MYVCVAAAAASASGRLAAGSQSPFVTSAYDSALLLGADADDVDPTGTERMAIFENAQQRRGVSADEQRGAASKFSPTSSSGGTFDGFVSSLRSQDVPSTPGTQSPFRLASGSPADGSRPFVPPRGMIAKSQELTAQAAADSNHGARNGSYSSYAMPDSSYASNPSPMDIDRDNVTIGGTRKINAAVAAAPSLSGTASGTANDVSMCA